MQSAAYKRREGHDTNGKRSVTQTFALSLVSILILPGDRSYFGYKNNYRRYVNTPRI